MKKYLLFFLLLISCKDSIVDPTNEFLGKWIHLEFNLVVTNNKEGSIEIENQIIPGVHLVQFNSKVLFRFTQKINNQSYMIWFEGEILGNYLVGVIDGSVVIDTKVLSYNNTIITFTRMK